MANNFQIDLAPENFIQASSGGCGRGTVAGQTRTFLAFDNTTQEYAHSCEFKLPASYTGTGTLKAAIFGAMATATSSKVRAAVAVEALADGDTVDTDAASSYDTDNEASSATVPGTAGYPFEVTVTLTNDDGLVAGDWVRLRLSRNVSHGDDGASSDWNVYGLSFFEEA